MQEEWAQYSLGFRPPPQLRVMGKAQPTPGFAQSSLEHAVLSSSSRFRVRWLLDHTLGNTGFGGRGPRELGESDRIWAPGRFKCSQSPLSQFQEEHSIIIPYLQMGTPGSDR